MDTYAVYCYTYGRDTKEIGFFYFLTLEEDRHCLFCETGEIGSEVHLLLYCLTYEDIREVMKT